jgi:hypothetical protein
MSKHICQKCQNTPKNCECCEDPCGCDVKVYTSCTIYDGKDLPCIGVRKGDRMNRVLEKMEYAICKLTECVDEQNSELDCSLLRRD